MIASAPADCGDRRATLWCIHICQYGLQQGALEIEYRYIEEHFGEFPRKKTGMSLALLKLSGDSVHDYATISDDSPSPSCASRARSAATS